MAGSVIVCLRRASSTNDVAAWLASRGCPEGLVVAAESQWAGRGRFRRTWHSPAGEGVWFSIVLRPAGPAGPAQALTFLGAIAAARAIRRVCALPAALKWPNDVVIAGRKVAGVLAEVELGRGQVKHAVIGVGINVNTRSRDFPPAIRETATSLRSALGRTVDRARLLRGVLEELDRRYSELREEGPGALIAEAAGLMPMAGSIVRARDHSRTVEGTVAGLDDDGALLVRLSSGAVARLSAGEVTILR